MKKLELKWKSEPIDINDYTWAYRDKEAITIVCSIPDEVTGFSSTHQVRITKKKLERILFAP